MQPDANLCICAFCFEYQRLRKIRSIIQTAHTLTSDAMRRQFARDGRNDPDVQARLDMGLRMGLLGLGSASASIVGTLVSSNSTIPLLVGMGLSSTALVGLHFLKIANNPQLPFLAVGGTWIAGLAYLTSMHPVAAVLALATSLVILGRARVLQSPEITPAIEQKVQSSEENEKNSFAEDCLLLDSAGCVISTTKFGNLDAKEGARLVDRVHIADRVQFLRAVSQLRAGELPSINVPLRIDTAKNGQVAVFEDFDLEMTMQGQALELLQSTKCVETTEPAQDEEEGADKRFLAIVSHELRTPLNAIIGFSEVLRGDLRHELSEATRSEYIELIHGAGSHLLSLVNTILDVSKIESGTYAVHRDEFDFPQTARECMAMLGAQAKSKNILVNDRITSQSGIVNGDRRAIKQILINLLSNAVKYTEPNGFVTVDAQINEHGLVFEVSDTGIGMCSSDLEMIGKPFTQIDNSITRSNEGTGLGLALVKGLVELHGGRLEISSKQGVGTNVKVLIPNEPEQTQIEFLPEASPSESKDADPSEVVSELQSFSRKEIGHGTRKAG